MGGHVWGSGEVAMMVFTVQQQMKIERLRVRFACKHDDWLMVFAAWFLGPKFMERFWTTYRLPGQKHVTIAHPKGVKRPEDYPKTVAHELVHAEQFRPWWGPWKLAALYFFFPLPVLFSGRWFVERPAYLQDIRSRRLTLDDCVHMLWRNYGYPWPRSLMRRWFKKEVSRASR